MIGYVDADMNVAPYHLQAALRWLEPRADSDNTAGPNLQSQLHGLGVSANRSGPNPHNLQTAPPRLEVDADPGGSMHNLPTPGRGLADPRERGGPGRSTAHNPQMAARGLESADGRGGPGGSTGHNLQTATRGLEGAADLVAGRRDLTEYAADEGLVRLLAGGLVQATRRLVVMSAVRDTQCGFKVFRRELGRAIFSQTRIDSFAFDIEVLFLARKLGAHIVEMPVSTTYRAESTFSVRKHLPRFLKDIAQIRLNDLAGRYHC